jgi:outer membrane protein insertion porin family
MLRGARVIMLASMCAFGGLRSRAAAQSSEPKPPPSSSADAGAVEPAADGGQAGAKSEPPAANSVQPSAGPSGNPDAPATPSAGSPEVASESPPSSASEPEQTGPRVPETICQGKRIVRIEISGQGRVSSDDIRATLKLRDGFPCNDAEVTRDAQALWDLGYFRDVRVLAEPEGDGVIVRFEVSERPAVGSIVYLGIDHLEQSDIEEKVTLKPGGILSVPDVRAQIDKIRDVYAEKGYFLAKVRYELADRANNEVEVRFIIEEGAAVSVRRIRFVGNDKLSARELKAVIQTSEKNVFSFISSSDKYKREIFDEDVNRIHALYYDFGYLTVELEDPRIELSPERRYIDVTIPVKEGPRFRVGRVKVMEVDSEGKEIEPLPGRKLLRESVEQNPGDWFSRSTIAKNLQDITRYYRDRGYAKVEVNPETAMHMDVRKVDVSLTIRRGPLVYVERINVKGNTKTRDTVLRREARIVEGDLYSQTLVERSKERMTALGYFESVTVSEEPGSGPDKIVINFEVAEKPTGTFQLGAGFSSQEVFLLNGQIQQENLLGRGQSLALNLQLSGIRQLAQLRFFEPYLFETDWSTSVEVFKILQQRRDFDRDSTGASLTLGHPLDFISEYVRVYATYRLEYIDIKPSTGGVFGRGSGLNYSLFSFLPLRNLFNSGRTSALRLAISVDTRNNRLFPTSGFYGMASTEISDKAIASDNDFIRHEVNLRGYQPIWGPFVLKLQGQWGLVTSRDGKGVPIYERYFLGGITDVRGFDIQSLGPRIGIAGTFDDPTYQTVAARGEPFGGNMEIYYNAEIEFPLIESVGIKGVVFQDGGNAWNLEKSLCGPAPSMSDPSIQPCGHNYLRMRTSWGFGIRWFSPLGPLRFEWGFPFNPRRPYEDTYEFQFNVGNSF